MATARPLLAVALLLPLLADAVPLTIAKQPLLPIGLPRPQPALTTGDLKLAFLAPLRQVNPESGRCETVSDEGLDLAEVAVFAAKRANEEILNGTGVSIGLQIMDSCPGMAKILTNLMLPMAEEAECPLSKISFRPTARAATTVGIVGLDTEKEIAEYRDFAMHFNIPAIAFADKAAELASGPEDSAPFLFRTAPSGAKLYAAMARQIETMSPSSLGVIVEDSDYGRRGKEVMAKALAEKGVHNVRYELIPDSPDKADIARAVENLVKVPGASLLAFVVCDSKTALVMEGLSQMDAALLRPIIGPNGFGNFLNISNAKRFENMVVVRHSLNPIPGFANHYRSLCENGGNTPWWHEKWGGFSSVQLSAKRLQCHQSVPDKSSFHSAANAIYAFAHALRRFVVTSCSAAEKSACAQYLEQCWARESVMGHLRTVNFAPLGAEGSQRFTFDREQAVEPNYQMVQLKVRSSIVQWDASGPL